MVTAVILINAERSKINETATALTDLDGVAEVYSVAGDWDLVALLRVPDNDRLADLVTNHMLKIESIKRSTTLVAFRAYSKFDLERMFSIGFEEK